MSVFGVDSAAKTRNLARSASPVIVVSIPENRATSHSFNSDCHSATTSADKRPGATNTAASSGVVRVSADMLNRFARYCRKTPAQRSAVKLGALSLPMAHAASCGTATARLRLASTIAIALNNKSAGTTAKRQIEKLASALGDAGNCSITAGGRNASTDGFSMLVTTPHGGQFLARPIDDNVLLASGTNAD